MLSSVIFKLKNNSVCLNKFENNIRTNINLLANNSFKKNNKIFNQLLLNHNSHNSGNKMSQLLLLQM